MVSESIHFSNSFVSGGIYSGEISAISAESIYTPFGVVKTIVYNWSIISKTRLRYRIVLNILRFRKHLKDGHQNVKNFNRPITTSILFRGTRIKWLLTHYPAFWFEITFSVSTDFNTLKTRRQNTLLISLIKDSILNRFSISRVS